MAAPTTRHLTQLLPEQPSITVAGNNLLLTDGSDLVLTDTASGLLLAVQVTSYNRTLADNAAGSDSLVRVVGRTRTLADNSASSDSLVRTNAKVTRILADAAASSDSLVRTQARVTRFVADTAAASDSLTRTRVSSRSLSDASAALDVLSRVLARSRTLADAAAGADSLVRLAVRSRSLADDAASTDSLTRTFGRARSLADNAAASDSLVRSTIPFSRSLADAASASDALSRVWISARSVSDDAFASDSLVRLATYGRSLADDAFTADVLTAGVLSRSLADSATVEDHLVRGPADHLLLEDGTDLLLEDDGSLLLLVSGTGLSLPRVLADGAAASDSLAVSGRGYARSLGDGAAAVDSLARLRSLNRTLADNAAASDVLTRTLINNDYFSAATNISGTSGSTTWRNTGYQQQHEVGEPNDAYGSGTFTGYYTAWFKITPSADAQYQFLAAAPASVYPLLTIYTGTLGSLTTIAFGGLNSGGANTAQAMFSATAGTTYYVHIGVYNFTTTNSGTLDWESVTSSPSNDNFVDAVLITGASGTLSGQNTNGATHETNEPYLPFYPSSTSVWYKWVATGDGILDIDAPVSGSGDTMLGVYKGTALSNLERVGAGDGSYYNNGPALTDARTRCRVESGVTYYIKVEGYRSAWVDFDLTWSVAAPTVTNDYYENATVISGSSGSTSGSLLDSSSELGEPWLFPPGAPETDVIDTSDDVFFYAQGTYSGSYDWGGWSRWYGWTCPSSGVYQFDTIGSTEWTLLGVFPSAATLLSLDHNSGRANAYGAGDGDDYRSLVTIRCEAGQVYKIVVQGDYGGTGDFVLNWGGVTPPANDDLANAIELTGASGTLTGTTFNATHEDGEWPTVMYGSGRSVWYKADMGHGGWPEITLSDYGDDGISCLIYTGPEDATDFSELSFNFDGYSSNWDYGPGTITIGENDTTSSLGFTGWIYIQIDSYDGIQTDFTLSYEIFTCAESLTYSGPPLTMNSSLQSYQLGMMCLDGTRRNVDLEIHWTPTSIPTDGRPGIGLVPRLYTDPANEIARPGVPATTTLTSEWVGADSDLLTDASAEGVLGPVITRWRIPIPEGATGILDLYITRRDGNSVACVRTIDSWNVEFYSTDPPVNDRPSRGIDISGTNEYAVPADAWAGATYTLEENTLRGRVDFSGDEDEDESIGRTIWFRWTPVSDNQILYFWRDMVPLSGGAPTSNSHIDTRLTVFTDHNITKVLLGGASQYWQPFGFTQEADDMNPYFDAPAGEYDYWWIPARHDIAGTRAGTTTYYLRVDIYQDSPLPVFDWRYGWFVEDGPTEQYGPDDFAILSADLFAGNSDDFWYVVDHKNEEGFERCISPSETAVAGRVRAQFDLPHPNEETIYAALDGSDSTAGGNSSRWYEIGDVDVDGTVYAPHQSEVGGVWEYGVAVWNRGLLNIATFDRFNAALAEAEAQDPQISPADIETVNIVGDEVWIDVGRVNDAYYTGDVRVRCSKNGDFLGIVYRNFWYMWPINSQRTLFIGNTGEQIWDTTTNTVRETGLPSGGGFSFTGAYWIPYKYGVVKVKGLNNNHFVSTATGSPTVDFCGTGWEEHSAVGGTARVTELFFFQFTMTVTWTSGFPTSGGVVFRLVDGNNYLVAKRTGVYKVVNGIESLVVAYNSGYTIPTTGSGSMQLIINDPTFRVRVGGVDRVGSGSNGYTDWTHAKSRDTAGFKVGTLGASSFGNVTIVSRTFVTNMILDATNEQYDPWDGTYRIQNWDLSQEIIRAERFSPWFDDFFGGGLINVAIGRDGKTAYIVRWFEAYEEYDRAGYYNIVGNWIVTHVYAFDLETQTYLGKVGKYDHYPSMGPGGWFQTIYPYTIMGGYIYSGLREKSVFMGSDARLGRPTQLLSGELSGTSPNERLPALDGPESRTPTAVGRTITWQTDGPVYSGDLPADPVLVNGVLLGVVLTAGVAASTTTTLTIKRDGEVVGTAVLLAGQLSSTTRMTVPWETGQEFSFTVEPGTGLEGLSVEGRWMNE